MADALNEIARAHVAQHGLTPEIAGLVELWLSPADENGIERANISIGYSDAGRRRETALLSLPNLDEAMTTLGDRARMGAMLCLGVQAMPASRRPAVPDWVRDSVEARRTREGLRRATGLAEDAIRGNARDGVDAGSGDAPF